MNSENPLTEVARLLPKAAAEQLLQLPADRAIVILAQIRKLVVEWEATQPCRILCWSCYVETMRAAHVVEPSQVTARHGYRLLPWAATA